VSGPGLTVDQAREILCRRGRRLSDEEIIERCQAADALARIVFDLLNRPADGNARLPATPAPEDLAA
jgi:hypothetical protein